MLIPLPDNYRYGDDRSWWYMSSIKVFADFEGPGPGGDIVQTGSRTITGGKGEPATRLKCEL